MKAGLEKFIPILLPGAAVLIGLSLQNYPLARISTASAAVLTIGSGQYTASGVGVSLATLPVALYGAWSSHNLWSRAGYALNAIPGLFGAYLAINRIPHWLGDEAPKAPRELSELFLPIVAYSLHRACSPSNTLIGLGITAWSLISVTSLVEGEDKSFMLYWSDGVSLVALVASGIGLYKGGGAPYIAAIALSGLTHIASFGVAYRGIK